MINDFNNNVDRGNYFYRVGKIPFFLFFGFLAEHGSEALLKGLLTDVTVSSLRIRITLSSFDILIPVAATVDFMVSRIGHITLLLLLVDHFGPIRDAII